MPPNMGQIQGVDKAKVKSLAAGEARILSLLDLDGWGAALASSQFDQNEWVETLVGHIRDSDAKVSLAALREFRQTILDLAKINGLITTTQTEATVQDQERKIKKVMSQQRIIQTFQQDTHRLEQMKNVEGPQVTPPLPPGGTSLGESLQAEGEVPEHIGEAF